MHGDAGGGGHGRDGGRAQSRPYGAGRDQSGHAARHPAHHGVRLTGSRAVGIILSGTGTDGTLGLRAIKAESGLTIAQEPTSAKYQGMPRSAIAAGVVDVVQPARQMSEPLLAYTRSLTRPALPLPEHEGSQTLR